MMRLLLRRLVYETDGSQLLYYALVGGSVTAILVMQADLVAHILDRLALYLRTFAAQLEMLF